MHDTPEPSQDAMFIPEYLRDSKVCSTIMEKVREGTHQPPWDCAPIRPDTTPASIDVVSIFTNTPEDKAAMFRGLVWVALREELIPHQCVNPALIRRV